MFFVCFSMFYIPCVSCFFFPCHILCFKICLVILSKGEISLLVSMSFQFTPHLKPKIYLYVICFFPRHTWETKLHFYTLKALKLTRHISTPHFTRFLYFTCLFVLICKRKHIKKIVCGFLAKTLWNKANKARI